jgi:uncharacterized protein involved in exopolysaccharide biosynthesis
MIRQRPPASSAISAEESDDLTLVAVANILLRHRLGIVLFSGLVAIAFLIIGILSPRIYTSTASFLPQGGQTNSSFSGLAAQLGVEIGGTNQGTSPAFYADLARSRQILGSVVEARYTLTGAAQPRVVTLVEVLKAKGDDSAHRRDDAIAKLSRALDVGSDPRTSVVTTSIKTERPEVSRQAVENLLGALSRFNLEIRQSQAGAERKFTEERLTQVRTDLRQAEDDLQLFLQRNRSVASAELEAQRERLTREVALQQQVYSTLAQAYERAKLEEVRDTPVLTVVQAPETPLKPDPRQLAARTLLFFFIAMMIASLVAIMRDRLGRHAGTSEDELLEFAELKRVALSDLRHPLRALRRRRA